MLTDRLSSNFITELFAAALERRTVMDITRQYMKFSYLQVEEEKKLWKFITERYSKTGRVPTVGQLQQQFIKDDRVLDLIEKINDVELADEDVGPILTTLENYIRQMKFLDANDRIADAYNQGNKEKAYNILISAAEDISKFTIQSAKFDRVFSDFNARQLQRRSESWNYRVKVPTCIDELDYLLGGTNGGPETGEAYLWMGISGAGKSQCLIHLGISAARMGNRVAHFQLEGTKDQALARYDSAWLGTLYQDVKVGDIPEAKMEISRRICKKLGKTDIIISSEESFQAKTMVDIRTELKEMERTYGKIDVIIIDYLELAEVGDGKVYSPHEERFRQAKLAQACKMLAMEFNAVVHTATQANDISPDEMNDPDFVITRYNLSEAKGKIRPFDGFITLNYTADERREEIMRLYLDKAREYKAGDVVYICNNMAYTRFYDRRRTMNMDWDEVVQSYSKKSKRDEDE